MSAEVSITLKAGPGYDEPWVVFKGDVDEVGKALAAFRQLGLFGSVKAATEEFRAAPVKDAQAAIKVLNGAGMGAQELPDDMKPKCDHGVMVFKKGHSTKQKRDYEGYFCPADDKTHKPEQFRWTS